MVDWDLISSYAGLFSLAVVSIYVGAHSTLPSPKRTSKGRGDEEDEDEVVLERLSEGDAWLFPIMGSGVLASLYAMIKFLGKEWINWFLGLYFSVTGAMSVWKSLVSLTKYTLGTRWKQFELYRLTLRKGKAELLSVSWRAPTVLLLPVGVIPSIIYTFWSGTTKSALLTDILALSFTHNALSLLKIDSFRTGCILLSGLFIYDIWWVFGTDVMVSVATTLDVPIKLLWPKSLQFSTARGFTMLGLGDIVIPGVFVALALRYDHHCSSTSASGKPYFYATLCSYVVGLITTIAVMHTFEAAQPALLYLSPACILSFVITSSVRGELKAAWGWSDELDEKNPSATQPDGAKATVLAGNGGDIASVDSQIPQGAKKEKTSG